MSNSRREAYQNLGSLSPEELQELINSRPDGAGGRLSPGTSLRAVHTEAEGSNGGELVINRQPNGGVRINRHQNRFGDWYDTFSKTRQPGVRSGAELEERIRGYELRLAQVAAEDHALRLAIELKARHAVALPMETIVGIIDGLLEAIADAIAEITETATYAAVKTVKRAGDGVQRGLRTGRTD